MKKSLIAIAFAVASMPMFAANQAAPASTPQANPPATEKPAKTKKPKKVSKKKSPKKDAGTTTPVQK